VALGRTCDGEGESRNEGGGRATARTAIPRSLVPLSNRLLADLVLTGVVAVESVAAIIHG